MNLNTIDEAIEILQAIKEGKEIEYYGDISKRWHTDATPRIPIFSTHTYRVKPETKHDWVVEYSPDRQSWRAYGVLYDKTEREVNTYTTSLPTTHWLDYRYRKVEAVS